MCRSGGPSRTGLWGEWGYRTQDLGAMRINTEEEHRTVIKALKSRMRKTGTSHNV